MKKLSICLVFLVTLAAGLEASASVPNWRANFIVTGVEVSDDGKVRLVMKDPVTGSRDLGCTVNDNGYINLGELHYKTVISLAVTAAATGKPVDVYFDVCENGNWAHIKKFMIHE